MSALTFLLQRPTAVLTVTVGLLVLGMVSLGIIPVSLLPETAIPQIAVQINYEGNAATELERSIVQPIRNQLLQVNRLEDIRSETQDGQATIQLTFEFGTNTNLAFIEVNEQIDQIASRLPRDMQRPSVLKASVTNIPVFYLSVVSKEAKANPLELANFTQTILKRRIEQLPQVAFVDVSGFAQPQVTILPNERRLQTLGLTVGDIERLLKENNVDLGSILLQDGQYQYNLRFELKVSSKADIENIYFRHEGQVLQLKDIAEVKLEAQSRRGLFLHNDREGVVLAIRKQADAQLFALQEEFDVLIEAFARDYPELNFYVSNDQSKLLEVSIDNLRTSLLYGAFFAVIVMFLFFRGWRAPLLIAIAIPVALLLSLIGFYSLDISINIISLSGLILGVGLMIDNSIIVIENIQQYRAMGYDWLEASARGANEVIRPLISSALTTCSVFLPLLFLSGIAGELFYDQAVSISVALAASLLVAYVLLPTLMVLFTKKRSAVTIQKAISTDSFYTRSVDVVLKRKGWFLLLFAILLSLAFFPIQQLERITFPELSRTAVEIGIDWNESISLAENERRMLQFLAHNSDSTQTANSFIGEQQFLLTKEQQSVNQAKIWLFGTANETALQAQLSQQYPKASFILSPLKNVFDEVFGAEVAPLIVQLQSVESDELPTQKQMQPILSFLANKGLDVALPPTKEVYEVRIEREKLLLYNVNHETILQRLRALFNGHTIGTLNTANAYIPITVGEQESDLYNRLNTAQIRSQKGKLLPLSAFVTLRQSEQYKTVIATKSGRAILLEVPVYSEELIRQVSEVIRAQTNLAVTFSGQAFADQKTIKEMAIILTISLLLLYLILAAQFESLLQPFIVMLTVPVGIVGSLFVLYWFGQSLNIVSIIGIIVMSGIVVNDAILKVDMMNRSVKEYGLVEAIHLAGVRRLKPILMTSITTIFALTPVLFASGLGAELQRPLAYAVIGGLVMGTLSSLYFVPIVYATFYKQKT
ncbi:MAG: efflux RND transporter permease subunit [Bacteroidota bacterium]